MSWSVEFYQKENGEIPVLEFMLSLDAKMRAKVQQTIDLLENTGTGLREPYVAPLKGDKYKGIWELRVKFASNITRVFYFSFQGDTFVLLNGFKKKTMKTPVSELDRALRYKHDYERRTQNE
ncbi:type II toxin-antitoxin system RelE/ParE family toxin [Selenomonas sp. AE3005]|uniref:type II toxin-antitoxin system RelE/ParE family toxin n=1 Tax=Selenomonas sp. AE3005 TaxID=1485543 RepID=UPI0004853A4A|nr:type II toxin-antitoxin system RelE/ParE family toxin [Selenomonas sp. AE3005]